MLDLSKNKIKWIRSLHRKKARDQENCFVVEGEKIVREVLNNHPDSIELICAREDFDGPADRCFQVGEREMKQISGLNTPPSVLAVVRKKEWARATSKNVLVLDGIQDPGNFGTIVRTADWFGFDRIVCSSGTVDCYNAKAIQSTMGSVFSVSIEYRDLNEYLQTLGIPIYGALLDGCPIDECEISSPLALVVGNEGQGISEEIREHISHPVLIPGFGKAESLNVSVATGILLSRFAVL